MSQSKFLHNCKRLAFLGVISLTALSLAGAEVPRKAEDFAVQTGPGKYIWLSDHAGKTVILAFILTTCSHCQFTTGILNKMQKDYAGRGVEIVESAIEPMSSLNIPAFVQKLDVKFPVGYNQQTYAAKFLGKPENDPMFVPQIVFIDSKGIVRAQLSGEDPTFTEGAQETILRSKLDEILKGQGTVKPPAPKAAVKK